MIFEYFLMFDFQYSMLPVLLLCVNPYLQQQHQLAKWLSNSTSYSKSGFSSSLAISTIEPVFYYQWHFQLVRNDLILLSATTIYSKLFSMFLGYSKYKHLLLYMQSKLFRALRFSILFLNWNSLSWIFLFIEFRWQFSCCSDPIITIIFFTVNSNPTTNYKNQLVWSWVSVNRSVG